MDAYVAEIATNPAHTTVIFTLKEEPGALAETLKIFKVVSNFFSIHDLFLGPKSQPQTY